MWKQKIFFITILLCAPLSIKSMDQVANKALPIPSTVTALAKSTLEYWNRLFENQKNYNRHAFIVSVVENASDADVEVVNCTILSGYACTIARKTRVKEPPFVVSGGCGGGYSLFLRTANSLWRIGPGQSSSSSEQEIPPYTQLALIKTDLDGKETYYYFDNLPYIPCIFKVVITKEGELKIGDECSVCQERQDNFLLPCGHTFCKPCVVKSANAQASCPMCRNSYPMAALR